MALTITTSTGGSDFPKGVPGDLQYRIVEVAFDSGYVTGGEPLVASDVGLSKIWFVQGQAVVEDATGTDVAYLVLYDYANSTLKAYNADINGAADLDGIIEVASAADLSGVTTVRLYILGES